MACMKSDQSILKLVAKPSPRVTPKPVLKPRPTLPKQARFEALPWDEFRVGYSGLV